jgi:hypothetical protein
MPFDPRTALGQQPPAPVSINSFAPPRNRTPMLVTIVALVALALVIVGGLVFRGAPPLPTPTPSPTPTVTAAGPGHPFDTPDGRYKGRWEITQERWNPDGLHLEVRIFADEGPISFSFTAFANDSAEIVDPEPSTTQPDLRRGSVRDGGSERGWIYFPMTRGDATIILATAAGRQMSALSVKG